MTRYVHRGTNDGTVPWCEAYYNQGSGWYHCETPGRVSQDQEEFAYDEEWCPRCDQVWRELRTAEPPLAVRKPPPSCEGRGESTCTG